MAHCMIKVTCKRCGSNWLVDFNSMYAWRGDTCPGCDAKVNREIWQTKIKSVASAALDCNMELERLANEKNGPLFEIDFIGGPVS